MKAKIEINLLLGTIIGALVMFTMLLVLDTGTWPVSRIPTEYRPPDDLNAHTPGGTFI